VTGLDLPTNAPAEPGKLPEHPLISEQFEFGPVVDIIPSVAADRRTISMRVIAGLKEFAGYVSGENDYWDYVESEGANPAPPRPPPKPPRPIFRERQAMSSATLWDGQTFVLASREVTFKTAKAISLIELPKELAKDLVRRRLGTKGSETKALLVFVTPMIVDPAGNAIHTDADLPARTNSVPSLLPPSFK
jgi:Flp pilus assembly secretin CpaC